MREEIGHSLKHFLLFINKAMVTLAAESYGLIFRASCEVTPVWLASVDFLQCCQHVSSVER